MEQTIWRRPGVKHISLRKITKYELGFRPFMPVGTNVVHSLVEDNTGSIFSKTLFVDFRTEGQINNYVTLWG